MTIDKSCSVILAQTLAFVCFGSITNLVPNRDIQTQHANPPFLMQGAPSSRRAFNQPSQKWPPNKTVQEVHSSPNFEFTSWDGWPQHKSQPCLIRGNIDIIPASQIQLIKDLEKCPDWNLTWNHCDQVEARLHRHGRRPIHRLRPQRIGQWSKSVGGSGIVGIFQGKRPGFR